MRRVKNVFVPALGFCLSLNLFLTACTTTANRRDLWSPDKGNGPYTQQFRNMTLIGRSDHRSHTYTYTVYHEVGEQQQPSASSAAPLPPQPAPTPGANTPSASAPLPPPPGAAPAQ